MLFWWLAEQNTVTGIWDIKVNCNDLYSAWISGKMAQWLVRSGLSSVPTDSAGSSESLILSVRLRTKLRASLGGITDVEVHVHASHITYTHCWFWAVIKQKEYWECRWRLRSFRVYLQGAGFGLIKTNSGAIALLVQFIWIRMNTTIWILAWYTQYLDLL